jgi:hypothetical protein
MTMRRLTFTDGVYALALVGLGTVLVTGGGVVALVAGRFIEELQRARAARRVAEWGGAR